MADQGRQRRIAERIRESVASTLERKVKDPRLGFVTVTDVRITGDLQHATVFYTVTGDEEEQKKTRRALESSKGLIRSEVGAALGIRLTPTITFQADALPEAAASIEEALRAARENDAKIAAAAQGQSFAGDSGPDGHGGLINLKWRGLVQFAHDARRRTARTWGRVAPLFRKGRLRLSDL